MSLNNLRSWILTLLHNYRLRQRLWAIVIIVLMISSTNICLSFPLHNALKTHGRISLLHGVKQIKIRKGTTTKMFSTKQRDGIMAITNDTTNHKKLERKTKDVIESRLSKFSHKEPISIILINNPNICHSICDCPNSTFSNVIDLVGRERFKDMLVNHPNLTDNVLKAKHLKSKFDIIGQTLDLQPTSKKFKSLVKKITPDIIRRISRVELTKKIQFLKYDINLSILQTTRLISSWPQYLSYSYIKLQHCKDFFLNDIGLTEVEMCRMITTLPSVLAYSVDKNLRYKVMFLEDEVGCSKIQMKRIIHRYPRFFSISIENFLRPKLRFLTKLFTPQNEDSSMTCLSKLITSFPPLLWLSDSNTLSKVQFLQNELQVTNDETLYILSTMPPLLGLSIDNNLQPKTAFLKKEIGVNKLKEFVLYQPALLGYSLEKRIKPRIEKMKENGICFAYCQPYLMSVSDAKFDSWIALHVKSWSLAMQ